MNRGQSSRISHFSQVDLSKMRATVDLEQRDSITVEIVKHRDRSAMAFKGKNTLDTFREELTIDDHLLPLPKLLKRYSTDIEYGLDSEWADIVLKKNGPNALMPPKMRSRFFIFCEYMFGGFSALLWIGSILALTGHGISYSQDPETPYDQVYLAAVLLSVIIITGLFGFYQESANNNIMDSFRKMIPKAATVIRDGKKQQILSEYVVLGDVVVIESGDCIPADIRIVESNSLKVDNSSITGEAEPLPRSPECSDMNPLETVNLAFYGTNAVEGSGKGIVISTGDNTLMGHIAGLTSGLIAEITPIKKELRTFIRIITIIAIIVGTIFFVLALLLGYGFFQSFVYFIAIVMANVPEGLLVTMTACLTLTAKKMQKKNCLVKNLHAIETLGSTTVICSDKTGTLTQNRMTVSHIFFNNDIVDILDSSFKKSNSATFNDLCRSAVLCSRAEFDEGQDNVPIFNRKVIGDASETAVLKCMEILTENTAGIRTHHPKIFEKPFNSTNKYQLSIHKDMTDENGKEKPLLIVIKGAPERILARCTTMGINNEDVPLDNEIKKKLYKALLDLGYMGERVLGFADLVLPPEYDDQYKFDGDENSNFPMDSFRFLGFMSMIDPPRSGVPEAVAKCKSAGIRVIMVTGDHPITAMAIAKKVGILAESSVTVYDLAMRANISMTKVPQDDVAKCNAIIVTGSELREMDAEEVDAIVENYDEIVFARTSPQQKLQIVEAFQRAAELVAVTGDGVNDSPALKKADIGIAMGISGSEVSKEAADMIILDDNFASIVTGIEEGRLIYDNLKKSIAYMLTSNVPEVMPFLLHVVIGFPQGLSVMAILIIDVGTDLWPGISLAYEKAENDIMNRPPRNPNLDRLVGLKLLLFVNINVGLLQASAAFCCFFYTMAEHGFLPDRLLFIREEWDSKTNDVIDSYGQEWAHDDRVVLLKKSVAAVFLAIVLTQIADCIICKTRRLSIIQHGMGNVVMNYGLIFEVFVACLVVYCPGLNQVLQFEPVHPYLLLPAIPFVILLILFDELRKYLIRKSPGGWVVREAYF